MAIRRCPYCKAIIDESQKYCNNCGTQLLFPSDEQDEEPIKGERIVDADFKDVDESDEEDDRLLAKDEADLEEIDLEQVLEGGGHFPDEARAKPKASRAAPRTTPEPEQEPEPDAETVPSAKPSRRATPKPPPRAAKKSAAMKTQQDTKEEIARLIAVLEEKERKRTDPGGEAEIPPLPPEPAVVPMSDKPTGLGAAWAELLEKPPSVDLDGAPIEIPRIPDTSPEMDFGPGPRFDRPFREEEDDDKDAAAPEDEDRVFEPPASFAPGDTMDFQNEVMAHTPMGVPAPPVTPEAPPAEPTRMGIPERITREEIFQDRDENETPPESVFDGLKLRPDAATAPTSELLEEEMDEEPAPRRRLGFFRKTAALLFDVVFIGAVWAATLWLAALLMGIAPAELVAASPVAAGILLAALLGGYFFLFLFFLGETLGDRMASRKS